MKNWFDIVTPHEDIRKGDFDEAVFAADLGDVVAKRGAEDYKDPYTFYKKTYLTENSYANSLGGRILWTSL